MSVTARSRVRSKAVVSSLSSGQAKRLETGLSGPAVGAPLVPAFSTGSVCDIGVPRIGATPEGFPGDRAGGGGRPPALPIVVQSFRGGCHGRSVPPLRKETGNCACF